MGLHKTPFERLIQQKEEEKFRALSSKELRKLVFRKKAGLHPMEKFRARDDAILATKILFERKNTMGKRGRSG